MLPLLAPLLVSAPLHANEDLTHLVDVYRDESGVVYTNTSDVPLRCQISSKVDEDLPFGTLAEKRNVTIRGYMSYKWRRNPTSQIILCYRLVEESNVFTLELGIEDVDGASYIGLEEMVVVTANGCDFISNRQDTLSLLVESTQ